jgi:hypothetical protein
MRQRDPRPHRRRGGRVFAVLLTLLVTVCTPVAVVVLASGETAALPIRPDQPGSVDPLRPSAPFFAGAGDGVRPNGIGCSSAEGTAVRARAHLDIFADGRRVTVPANIGALAGCRYWLHTLADDGVVHVSSPERRTFTLGDVADIWGAPLSRTRVLGFTQRKLRAFVDGRRATGDVRDIAIKDGREIALVIGRAPTEVPRTFTFR